MFRPGLQINMADMPDELKAKMMPDMIEALEAVVKTIAGCNYDVSISVTPRWRNEPGNWAEREYRKLHIEHCEDQSTKMIARLRETALTKDMEQLLEHRERLDNLKAGKDIDYDFEVLMGKYP